MLKLEDGLVYGPILTRRFGWDLGINLLPFDEKLCTFDCVYCQYGFTPLIANKHRAFPEAVAIIAAWERGIARCKERKIAIAHTTISGNGEPCMHPHFSQVVAELIEWRDRHSPGMRLAILSNGTRLQNKEIRDAVLRLDEPIIKLDSAIDESLQQINQPLNSMSVSSLVEQLSSCKGIIIQTMLLKGWNSGEEDIRRWELALRRIQPREVQIYTISRAPARPDLVALTTEELRQIAAHASQSLGIPVTAYL